MIRKAKPSEIEQIMKITKACAAKMISQNIFQWNAQYPNKESFLRDLQRNELFVMSASEKVIGCIVISSEKDIVYNSINWLTPDGKHYYIHRLAIHPKFQHQGNAKKLMDFAETYSKQHRAISIRLDTFSQNIRNQQFYEHRGYQRLGNIYFPKQSNDPFYCYELLL